MKDHVAPILEELRKSKEELETLRAENAKLIAERDESNKVFGASDRKLLDRLLAERDEAQSDNESLEDKLQEQMNLVGSLLVEREQWMKQEPVAYEHTFAISDNGTKFKIYTSKKEHQEAESSCPVFAHPLPAQQAPEGLAESEFEKYFEQIGVDAWEDHPVSQAYIDGFNRAIELSAAPKPGDK